MPVTDSERERLQLTDGDLLFVRSNGNPDFVGRCAVFMQEDAETAGFDEPIIYASYLIRARIDSTRLVPEYLSAYLNGVEGRRALRAKCKTSAGQYNLNTTGLGSIGIPVPPIEDQQNFKTRVDGINKRATAAQAHLDGLDALFASHQQRAFRGEM